MISQVNRLAATNQLMARSNSTNISLPVDESRDLLAIIKGFARNCEELSMIASSTIASTVANELEKIINSSTEATTFTVHNSLIFRNQLNSLIVCINAETSVSLAHVMTPEQQKLFAPKTAHWPDVRSALPDAAFDIDEAAKCLALGRHTAAVFHCMRILEACLSKIQTDLNLQIGNNPNWGVSLRSLKDHITNKGSQWSHKNHYLNLLNHFQCIKDALRNPTMHMERIYVFEEAQLIHTNSHALAKLTVMQP